MKKFPVDKQVEYYLAGIRYVHPPQIGLADDIAQQGKQALPTLLRRLKEETDESNQSSLIYVFELMHTSYYNLKGESDVITALKELTAQTKSPKVKSRSQEALDLILTNKMVTPQQILENVNKELRSN